MPVISIFPALLRGLHILSVCAWLGGGLGVIVLLLLGQQTESTSELQAYDLVITAIDDHLISPGAAGTVVTGLLLIRARKIVVHKNRWLRAKLAMTVAAISFGALALAPWLEGLLKLSRQDGLAVFEDRGYLEHYYLGMSGSMIQMLILVFLLWGSIAFGTESRNRKQCGGCPLSRRAA